MKLNREQAKHLAETLRIVAIAQFGVYGYHGITGGLMGNVIASAFLFVYLEFVAVFLLEGNDNGSN